MTSTAARPVDPSGFGVWAGLPAMRLKILLGRKGQGGGLESCPDRVIPAVQKTEECDDRNDLSHFLVRVKMLGRHYITVGDRVGGNRERQAKGRLLRFAEQWTFLEIPYCFQSFCVDTVF